MHFLPSVILASTGSTAAAEPGIYGILIPLIPLLPILGFAFTALFGRRLQAKGGRTVAEIVPVGLVVAVWVIAMMVVVAAIGIFTAILAASIAFTQTDIKRVLAYSTLSQLGYMFAALGVGAYTAAIFHLMTHGFFKGLLFLGSGSVIHAVHEEQNMNRLR